MIPIRTNKIFKKGILILNNSGEDINVNEINRLKKTKKKKQNNNNQFH